MHFNPFSRRYFLRGVGASLCLPFLPSLMPRAYAAVTGPRRYVQLIAPFGHFPEQFYTADTALTQTASGIYAKPLSAIAGNFSPVIGAEFNNLKGKFSVLRGLSVPCGQYPSSGSDPNHNTSLPTCSSALVNGDENVAPPFPYSVDSVLSESLKIYPNPAGMQRHINFAAVRESWPNFSWNRINGSAEWMPATTTTAALLAKFARLNNSPTPTDPIQNRNLDVLSGVFSDYKSVRDSAAISSADKIKLESYMSLIEDVQKGLQVSAAPATCSKPLAETESDVHAEIRNQINVLVAAMACDLTRVGALTFSVPYQPMHGLAHAEKSGYREAFLAQQILISKHVAYLLGKMDMVVEGTQTMLDNSVVYWGNEFGENPVNNVVSGGAGGTHTPRNMTALVAGGAGGALQMGYYIDYKRTGGRPLNNFLVSILNAMGLASGDYERGGNIGFGEYQSAAVTQLKFSAYASTIEKRSPLPFFYKGPAMG